MILNTSGGGASMTKGRGRLVTLLVLFLVAPPCAGTAQAAAFTSKATGNWSSAGQTVWNEVGVPGAGDTVTIGTGHTVTVTDARTIGDGTDAVCITNLTGTIAVASTVSSSATLTIRGQGTWGQSRGGASYLTVLSIASTTGHPAGVVLDCDATHTPIQTFDTDSRVTITGTAADRCFVKTLAGGTAGNPGRFTNALKTTSELGTVATYCDFINLGDASNAGWGPITMYIAGEVNIASFDHCTFTGCGPSPWMQMSAGDAVASVTNCTWSSYPGVPMEINTTGAKTTGTRLLQYCVFLGIGPNFNPAQDFTISICYFDSNFFGKYDGPQWASFTGSLVHKSDFSETTTAGNISDTYWITDPASGSPASGFYLISATGSSTHSGNVFDLATTLTDDYYAVATTDGVSANRTVTVTGNVMTRNAAGGAAGPIVEAETFAAQAFDTLVVATHNTLPVGSGGGVKLSTGSGAAERAHVVQTYKDNLLWNAGAATVYALTNVPGGGGQPPVTDCAVATACGNNAWCNLAAVAAGTWSGTSGAVDATTTGTVYDSPMSGTTAPGAADVLLGTITDAHLQGPKFVDPTRNLAAWSVHKGYALVGDSNATKVANALTQIRADLTLIADARDWVRAGFAPQNPALHNTASDATDIGAVAYQAATNPVPIINGGFRRRVASAAPGPPKAPDRLDWRYLLVLPLAGGAGVAIRHLTRKAG